MSPSEARRAGGLRAAALQRVRRETERRERWAAQPALGYSLAGPSAAFLLELLRQRGRSAPDMELRTLLLAWTGWPAPTLMLALAELRLAGDVVRTGPETYRLTQPGEAPDALEPWDDDSW